jgi:hypothetical protein
MSPSQVSKQNKIRIDVNISLITLVHFKYIQDEVMNSSSEWPFTLEKENRNSAQQSYQKYRLSQEHQNSKLSGASTASN